jgi:hypothetical protein
MISINFWAIIVAAVVAFIIGFLMHGPIAGKLWMKLADIHPTGKEKLSDMYGKMFSNLVVNIISAAALSIVFGLAWTSSLFSTSPTCVGILSGILVWLGFNVTATSIDVIWMGKSAKLWIFEAVSSLIVFVAMGAIIGAW